MRIADLAEREDVGAVVSTTLARAFSVQVDAPPTSGQRWYEQPLVSAYVVADVADEPRRFLVDQIRYTPRRARAVPQFVVGTLGGTRLGFRLARRPAFSVTPPIEGAEQLVIIPGNQRLRILDFARRRTRVLLKDGFATTSIANEIAAREAGPGPFPPILERDPERRWIVEPLLDGFTLPRCPPWRPRRDYERRAIEMLGTYHAVSARAVATAEHVRSLRETVARLAREVGIEVEPHVEALARRAERAVSVEIARGHGDFQAGNVFVEPRKDAVWLIDWETAGVRQRAYDALTYALGSRFPAGLGRRVRAFIAGAGLGPAGAILPPGGDWRPAAAALFLLEDLRWRLDQAASGRYLRVPGGLTTLIEEIGVFLGG